MKSVINQIGLLVLPCATELDLTLHQEVFRVANGLLNEVKFCVDLLTVDDRDVQLTHGRTISPTAHINRRREFDLGEGDAYNRALIDRARQSPGREKEVWDFYRNNPNALAQLRAPIYEDKVVDFILELANVTEKKVTRDELVKEDEDDKTAA